MTDTPNPRQRAHDTVHARLHALGGWLPRTPTERDVMLWAAVHDALDAAGVPRPAETGRHDSGPSVAECVEADRRWPLEKHGE